MIQIKPIYFSYYLNKTYAFFTDYQDKVESGVLDILHRQSITAQVTSSSRPPQASITSLNACSYFGIQRIKLFFNNNRHFMVLFTTTGVTVTLSAVGFICIHLYAYKRKYASLY